LHLSRRHLEFFGEILTLGCIWFLVSDEDVLENLELGGGSTLSGLDSVGNVCVEHL
jgi:hypothetical protein